MSDDEDDKLFRECLRVLAARVKRKEAARALELRERELELERSRVSLIGPSTRRSPDTSLSQYEGDSDSSLSSTTSSCARRSRKSRKRRRLVTEPERRRPDTPQASRKSLAARLSVPLDAEEASERDSADNGDDSEADVEGAVKLHRDEQSLHGRHVEAAGTDDEEVGVEAPGHAEEKGDVEEEEDELDDDAPEDLGQCKEENLEDAKKPGRARKVHWDVPEDDSEDIGSGSDHGEGGSDYGDVSLECARGDVDELGSFDVDYGDVDMSDTEIDVNDGEDDPLGYHTADSSPQRSSPLPPEQNGSPSAEFPDAPTGIRDALDSDRKHNVTFNYNRHSGILQRLIKPRSATRELMHIWPTLRPIVWARVKVLRRLRQPANSPNVATFNRLGPHLYGSDPPASRATPCSACIRVDRPCVALHGLQDCARCLLSRTVCLDKTLHQLKQDDV